MSLAALSMGRTEESSTTRVSVGGAGLALITAPLKPAFLSTWSARAASGLKALDNKATSVVRRVKVAIMAGGGLGLEMGVIIRPPAARDGRMNQLYIRAETSDASRFRLFCALHASVKPCPNGARHRRPAEAGADDASAVQDWDPAQSR
jgi:hypothetical protein